MSLEKNGALRTMRLEKMRVDKMPFEKLSFEKLSFEKLSFEKLSLERIVLEKNCALRELHFERGGLQAARNSAKLRGFSP